MGAGSRLAHTRRRITKAGKLKAGKKSRRFVSLFHLFLSRASPETEGQDAHDEGDDSEGIKDDNPVEGDVKNALVATVLEPGVSIVRVLGPGAVHPHVTSDEPGESCQRHDEAH